MVIAQLQYATTPRYNFPQILEDLRLPKRFIELSLISMQNAKGKYFQPYGLEDIGSYVENPQHNDAVKLNSKSFSALLRPLKPICDETPVAAIDVSSIRIGETENGILCAVRGAVVWSEKRRYRYLRLGPFPFHVTEENKREILNLLGQCGSSSSNLGAGTPTLLDTQNRLCNLIERWLQMSVSSSSRGSIILWDGSLTAGTTDSPVNVISQILTTARENSNSVLAFSKATTIRFLGWKITDLVLRHPPPCILEVEGLPLSAPRSLHFLGGIYVAKLTNGSCSFRVDIDSALLPECRMMAVQRLLGNDLIFQSYPETLRLAHILSTFTANDVIGIQCFITHEYGLRMITRPNVRKMLFGPFGTGFED